MRYHFGTHNTHVTIEAPNLRRAIRIFRVGTPFPHTYSTAPIRTSMVLERGYDESVCLASKPGAVIEIHVAGPKGWEVVETIPPEAPSGEEDFRAVTALLAEGSGDSPVSGALVPVGALTGLGSLSRRDVETRELELRAMMGALEQQKHLLGQQVAELKAELKRRLEQVWLIELFLGSKEEVKVLREGAPASVEERISVRQRVLCMDEEIAVYDLFHNPERSGDFGIHDLAAFDQWLLDPAHLAEVCPWPKGLVALRVRRHNKDRDYGVMDIGSILTAVQEDEDNKMVYLLVRNGEQLYRLWIDITLWPRMFASADDVTVKPDDRGHVWPSDVDRQQARLKHYAAGLVALAGLLQRSTLFHPLPRADLNPFDARDVDAYFNLVRDDEPVAGLLGDGRAFEHVTWDSYTAWLRKQIAVGVRVVVTSNLRDRDRKDSAQDLAGRCGMWDSRYGANFNWPSMQVPYEVVEFDDTKTWGHGYSGAFMYLPSGGGRWDRESGEFVDRTKRVRFSFYTDEAIPVDFVSWRVLQQLISDRGQRAERNYSGLFQFAAKFYRRAKAEAEAERPFIDLVLGSAGVALTDEAERARCERLLRWWKLKVKVHRTVAVDEAKAFRMVLAAFKRGDDHANDPEHALMSRSAP